MGQRIYFLGLICVILFANIPLRAGSFQNPIQSPAQQEWNDTDPLEGFPWDEIFNPYGDAWPWPWGNECPFPWFMIEGTWSIHSSEASEGFFGFKGVELLEDGSHAFSVLRYDKNKELIAFGRGTAERGSKIISVIMHYIGPNQKLPYLAQIRAYRNKDQNGCQKEENLVTAVTVIPVIGGAFDEDINFTIEKISHSEGFPGMEPSPIEGIGESDYGQGRIIQEPPFDFPF